MTLQGNTTQDNIQYNVAKNNEHDNNDITITITMMVMIIMTIIETSVPLFPGR